MKNLIKVIVFYGIISFIFLEVTLRILDYFPPFVPSKYSICIHENKVPMGIVPNVEMPGQYYEAIKGARVYLPPLKTNRFGQRDDEYSIEKKLNEFRILCIGDSYTFGWGVERGETWPDILETKLLKKIDRPLSVINAGRPGRDTRYNLSYLLKEGLSFNPDIVIYMIMAIDVKREIKYQAAQRGEEWALKSHTRNLYGKSIIIPEDAVFSDKVKLYLQKYSGVYYIFRKIIKEGRVYRIPTIDVVNRQTLLEFTQPDSSILSGWDIQADLIEQMKNACNDKINFIVAVVPHPIMVREEDYREEMSHRYFVNLLKGKEIDVIDFVEILGAKVGEKSVLMDRLFLGDDHPSALYYEIFVSEVIANLHL